jgi:tetratricopeptide (TPR) repeat protein
MVFGLGVALPVARAHAQLVCQADIDVTAIREPNAALERDPRRLEPRMRLAAALMERGCYRDVVAVLEEGQKFHPNVDELELLLRDARSSVEEEQYFAGLAEAEAAAQRQRYMLRCRDLADIAACDSALLEQPRNVALLTARAEAQRTRNGLAPALEAYRAIIELFPESAGARTRFSALQAERESLRTTCFEMADAAALRACDDALIRGNADEFEIQKRRGLLLQQAGEPATALDAYIAANDARRGDPTTARAIVALAQSTGRSDAIALAATGSAQLALGRVDDAIRSLREAHSLTPELGTVATDLAAAEEQSAALARECATAAPGRAIAACPRGSSPERAPTERVAEPLPPRPAPAPQTLAREYSNAEPHGQTH